MEFLKYNPTYIEEIRQLYIDTFSTSEGQEEGASVGELVADLAGNTDESDLYGFAAREKGEIVGCIFFSRLVFDNVINAFLLSPVATHPSFQGRGIGQKLIAFGLDDLKDSGIELVMTYGDPSFYSKVGFAQISENILQAPHLLSQPEGWLGQSLVNDAIDPIADKPRCVSAFDKPELW